MASEADDEHLYHYTDAAGLIGIMTGQSIWSTQIEYLNDASELIYARDELLAGLRDRLRDMPEAAFPDVSNAPERRSHRLSELIKWLERVDAETSHLLVASFSTKGDSLSQWRAYGGYAIGFRRSKLAELAASIESASAVATGEQTARCQLLPVRYGKDEQLDEWIRDA